LFQLKIVDSKWQELPSFVNYEVGHKTFVLSAHNLLLDS